MPGVVIRHGRCHCLSLCRRCERSSAPHRLPTIRDCSFAVGPVSVEFMVVTKREGGPEAKVRFWVVEAGASAQLSREATQKMSLTLTPVDEHGRPIYVLDPVMEPPP
jgi:hypothetical protein